MGRNLFCVLPLLLLSFTVLAEDRLQLAHRLIFVHPELTRPGSCVILKEGAEGFLLREPTYWLKARVVSARLKPHAMQACPSVPGKLPEQYSRDEYVRVAKAYPCGAEHVGEVTVGAVTVQAEQWETPYGRRAASRGRLFQGHYLDQKLTTGEVLEIPADLLQPCDPG